MRGWMMSDGRDERLFRWKFIARDCADPAAGRKCYAAVTEEPWPRTLFYSYDEWAAEAIRHAVDRHNDWWSLRHTKDVQEYYEDEPCPASPR